MNGWRRVLACAALLLLTKGAGAVGGDWRLATLELPPSIASSLPNQGYYAVLLRRVLAEFGAQPQFVFLPAQRAAGSAPTRSAISAMCSGVVPQQPPAMFRKPSPSRTPRPAGR
jgi:hypothetical protein